MRASHSTDASTIGPERRSWRVRSTLSQQRRNAPAPSTPTIVDGPQRGKQHAAGDLVATSTKTFSVTANAIIYRRAERLFVGCDGTGNMDATRLSRALSDEVTGSRQVKAIVPVDLLGNEVDHGRIDAGVVQHGQPVLSDAAESLGAVREGRSSATYGIATAASFNGNKIMTIAGGGALLTDDEALAGRVRYLATQARQSVVHDVHTHIGYYCRMSNVLVALGRTRLARLEGMIERRRQLRLWYRDLFACVRGMTMFGEPSGANGGTRDTFWVTSVLIDPAVAGFTSEELRLALAAEDIEARLLWKPIHLQPMCAGARGVVNGTSERLFTPGRFLPSGSVLNHSDLDRVRSVARSFFRSSRAAG